jgi:DNA-binding SARP family transcriptional activator
MPMLTDPVNWLLSLMDCDTAPVLHLFGGPFVTILGRRVEVPEGSKRLLVYVALHRSPVDRRQAAGVLWPVGSDLRAAGNLRSALWRLKGAAISLITADKHLLTLHEDLIVDLRVVSDWAARLIGGSASQKDLGIIPWSLNQLELLPGWYDDWALVERERVTQRVLHGLEVQSSRLVQHGRCAEAVEAAMIAASIDPLRESAQRALIEAHLAEGNWAEGRRRYDIYRDLLRDQMDIEPSPQLGALVEHGTTRYKAMSSIGSRLT